MIYLFFSSHSSATLKQRSLNYLHNMSIPEMVALSLKSCRRSSPFSIVTILLLSCGRHKVHVQPSNLLSFHNSWMIFYNRPVVNSFIVISCRRKLRLQTVMGYCMLHRHYSVTKSVSEVLSADLAPTFKIHLLTLMMSQIPLNSWVHLKRVVY